MNSQILWYASRSTGVVAQVLLTGVMVLGLLTAGRAGSTFARAAIVRMHRSLTAAVLVFTAVHIVTAIADGYVDLNALDAVVPFGSGFSPFWIGLGAITVDLFLAIGITSALRRRMPHRAWRVVHLTAYALWPIAMVHGWGTDGGDSSAVWMVALNVVCIVAVVAALIFRLVRRNHPDRAARLAGTAKHSGESLVGGRV